MMGDYRKMYYMLFNKISEIIEELQQVQEQTEEIFIEESELILVSTNPGDQDA